MQTISRLGILIMSRIEGIMTIFPELRLSRGGLLGID
jgi:hypothetical protein